MNSTSVSKGAARSNKFHTERCAYVFCALSPDLKQTPPICSKVLEVWGFAYNSRASVAAVEH